MDLTMTNDLLRSGILEVIRLEFRAVCIATDTLFDVCVCIVM